MRSNARMSTVMLSRLPAAEQEALLTEIHTIYREIFEGEPLELYLENKRSIPARAIKLRLVRDPSGRLLGYNFISFFDERIDGRRATFVRSEAAMLPGIRGANRMSQAALVDSLFHKLRYPLTESYFASMMISPAGYHVLAKLAREAYPRQGQAIPPRIERLRGWFVEFFGMQQPEDASPWVVASPFAPRETDEVRDAWRTHESPHVRFYLAENPHYAEGRGLIFFIPLSWRNLALSWWSSRSRSAKVGAPTGARDAV